MDVTFAHLADYASVSQEGKLSVMGIFHSINVPELPSTHQLMFLAFQIRFNYAEVGREIPLRIECVDADGNQLFKVEAGVRIEPKGRKPRPGDQPTLNQIIAINNARFTRIGTHNFNIFVDKQLKAQIEFEVIRKAPEADAGSV